MITFFELVSAEVKELFLEFHLLQDSNFTEGVYLMESQQAVNKLQRRVGNTQRKPANTAWHRFCILNDCREDTAGRSDLIRRASKNNESLFKVQHIEHLSATFCCVRCRSQRFQPILCKRNQNVIEMQVT